MRYEYKDTSIQSLGEVPSTWNICKVKNYFSVKPSNVNKKIVEGEIEVELCNYVDVYYNDSIDLSLNFMTASAKVDEIKKFQIKKGDVIITKDSEDPMDIAVPALVKETREKLLCGYHLSILRSKSSQFIGDYLFWVLKDLFIASQLQKEATGITRWAIASRHIKNTIIPFPPLQEQKAIADYLDKACSRIDRIIEIKEKQLAKLNNFETTIISDLITKGIEPKELIDTAYPWLPKIRKNWKIQPLKRLLESKLQYGANEPAENEDLTEPRYIRITDFGKDGKLKKNTFKSLPFEKAASYLLKQHDVLFARSGATVGKTFLFDNYIGKACFAGYLIKAECNKNKLLPKYLYYFSKTNNYEEWKNLIFTQATIQNIGADKYQYLIMPVPSIEEQEKIIKRIELISERVDLTRQKIQNQIKTLKTYRKSLIHECVTGKKQVFFENEKIDQNRAFQKTN